MTTTEQAKQGGNWPHLMKNNKDCNGLYNALIFMECNTFRLEALLHAAGQVGARESRDTSERRLHIATPGGTITVREKQEGWYDVLEADLPDDDYRDFWENLRSWTEGYPRMRRNSNRMPWEKNDLEEEPDPQDNGNFDRGRLFQLEAVMAAAESEDIRCTRDPVSYKKWHISPHGGWVVIWDAGNCWSNILEVDLRPEEAEAFWQRLQEYVESRPDEHLTE